MTITGDVLRTPASQLAAAIVLTILNGTALTGYDLLAFAYIRKPLPRAHIVLIVAGTVTSLLKGVDYEEALLLLVLLALLWTRRHFDRRAALFDARFSTAWLAALAGAIGSSVWLGFFAFKHVDYAQQLWWQFELHGDASRFMRASVGSRS